MTNDPRPNHRIIWTRIAVNKLAAAWNAYFIVGAAATVTEAERAIKMKLQALGVKAGSPLSEGLFVIGVPAIQVTYESADDGRSVKVVSVSWRPPLPQE